MKQITINELKQYKCVWIPSEHSCGYDTCYLDWENETVKQEQEYIDWCSGVEEFVKSQQFFYLKQKDTYFGENKYFLVGSFIEGQDVIVDLDPEDDSYGYLRDMDGKTVKLIHQDANGHFITDFFKAELMEECNDFTHYGFMKVFDTDIRHIDSK